MTPRLIPISHNIRATWGPRPESSEQIAIRFQTYIDSMIDLGPPLTKWRVGMGRGRLYEKVRDDLPVLIGKDIIHDDEGRVSPLEGYDVIGMAREMQNDQTFSFTGTVGSAIDNRISHCLRPNHPENFPILDYALCKSLVLLTVEAWRPFVCGAGPSDLAEHFHGSPFHEAWILYIPPDLANTVQPIDIPVVEATPDGGLLLVATTEPFRTDNPIHLAAAHRIAAVTSHLNIGRGFQGPWPKRPTPPPPKKPHLSESTPEAIAMIKRVFGDKWRQLFADD